MDIKIQTKEPKMSKYTLTPIQEKSTDREIQKQLYLLSDNYNAQDYDQAIENLNSLYELIGVLYDQSNTDEE